MLPRPPRHVQVASASLAALAAVLLAAGCTTKITSPPPPPSDLATPDSIQQIFDAHCASCHNSGSPAGGQDLSSATASYANIVDVASIELPAFKRIAPGDSANSYMVMKLRNDARIVQQPMPRGAFPLDADLVLKVAAWAQQGAPGVPVTAARTVVPLAAR